MAANRGCPASVVGPSVGLGCDFKFNKRVTNLERQASVVANLVCVGLGCEFKFNRQATNLGCQAKVVANLGCESQFTEIASRTQ